jgi:ribosome-associated protein
VSDLRVSRTCVIPDGELVERFSGSGGPGGQHANTANTRVELVFDVAGSAALGPRQRERLLERLGPSVRVVASDRRSQAQNRELARERLRTKLGEALRVQAVRRPTRKSHGAEERRLQAKHRQSDRKKARREGRSGFQD